MRSRLPHLIRKEIIQMSRDRRIVVMIVISPILQLFLLGYAATTDVKNISTTILDQDRSAESRFFIERVKRADNFRLVNPPARPQELVDLLDQGMVRAALVIPKGLSRNLGRLEAAPVQMLIDGTDAVSAGVVMGYLQQITAQANQRMLSEKGLELQSPAMIETRIWYNPMLESRNFMVPGVICMLLLVMTTILPSLTIVKEREKGTLEQLIVTPIRPIEMILGKLIPFVVIGYLDVVIVVSAGWILFGVVPKGSLALLFGMSGLFLLNTLGLGLLVSTVSRNQQQVLMTIFAYIFPSLVLAGFIFPINSMPEWIQWITYAIPLRYFLEIVRCIYLKGVGLEFLWPQTLALLGLGVLLNVAAVLRFKKRL